MDETRVEVGPGSFSKRKKRLQGPSAVGPTRTKSSKPPGEEGSGKDRTGEPPRCPSSGGKVGDLVSVPAGVPIRSPVPGPSRTNSGTRVFHRVHDPGPPHPPPPTSLLSSNLGGTKRRATLECLRIVSSR